MLYTHGFDKDLLMPSRVEVMDDPAEEIEEGGRDGRVRTHAVVHHQDGRLNVHDVILCNLIIRVNTPISGKHSHFFL